MRPFRFAVGGDAPTASEWRELVTRTEDHGYDILFVADHTHLPAGGVGYPTQHLAPFAAMTAAAAWTSTLRVGSRVLCIDYHVPVVLAKEAATLDLLSDGRMILGLGAGWHVDEYRSMGLTFADAPSRVQKLEEVVALVKAHFTGAPVELDGEFVQVHDYVGAPLPAQRPHPPIMIGGSKKRVLSLAGREGDIVSLSNVVNADVDTRTDIERQVADVRAAAGPRFDDLDFELMHVYVEITDDVDDALDRVAPAFGVDAAVLRDHPLVLIGSVARLADTLEERRVTLGTNLITIPHRFTDAFAPVVSLLSGT